MLDQVERGIEGEEFFLGGVELAAANVLGGVDDLPLQIARVNHIEIDETESADAGCGQIQRKRRAQTARSHAEDARGLQLLLALHAHFGQDEVARVAGEIGGGELGQLDWGGCGRHGPGSPVTSSLSGRRAGW